MRKSTRVLTHLERRIMRVLWESGAGNVQKVLQGLTSEPRRLGTVIKAVRGKVNQVGASLFPDYSMSWTLSRNFSIRFNLKGQARNSQGFALDAGRLGEHRVDLPVHLLQQKIEFLLSSPASSSSFVNCFRWLSRRSSSSVMSLRSASSAAPCAKRIDPMFDPFSNSLSRASNRLA
jgi:hypothetical protein